MILQATEKLMKYELNIIICFLCRSININRYNSTFPWVCFTVICEISKYFYRPYFLLIDSLMPCGDTKILVNIANLIFIKMHFIYN